MGSQEFLMLLVLLAIWLVPAFWVRSDAMKRGGKSTRWFFIVLIAGLVGVVIYLLVRPPMTATNVASSTTYPTAQLPLNKE